MINFLSANLTWSSRTIMTKASLKEEIKKDPSKIKFIPLITEPMTPAIHALNTTADRLPFGRPVSVTGPVGSKWKAEVERKFNGKIVVR